MSTATEWPSFPWCPHVIWAITVAMTARGEVGGEEERHRREVHEAERSQVADEARHEEDARERTLMPLQEGERRIVPPMDHAYIVHRMPRVPRGIRSWCLGPESNRRPFPLQGNALPTELPKQYGYPTIPAYILHLLAIACPSPGDRPGAGTGSSRAMAARTGPLSRSYRAPGRANAGTGRVR